MTDQLAPIAVVGASLAGLNAVHELVRNDRVTSVTVFGAEGRLPYDRPPLSKEILRGTWGPDRCTLEPVDDSRVTWRVGTAATAFDVERLRLRTTDGIWEDFSGGVVIATGASPRTIPGAGLPGVHVLRTLDDAIDLKDDLDSGIRRVVIVGGGFIGAEVAAACVERQLDVTLLEAGGAPLTSLGTEVGAAVMAPHLKHGVHLRSSTAVARLHGRLRVDHVELANGGLIPTDLVVLGLGVVPATEWLRDSGLSIDDGVECDATLLAAPRVVAAGDVARWPNHRFGEMRRVEHWDNAIRQGHHAARRLLAENGAGSAEAFTTVPWVWSDQYDHKLQVVGSTTGFEEMTVAHGSFEGGQFVALYRRGEHLTAAVGLDSAHLITRYRRLLSHPVTWTDALDHAAQLTAAGR